MAMADPTTVFRSMASWKTIADTTMIITRFAVFSTEDVTAPTDAVKAKANSVNTTFNRFLILRLRRLKSKVMAGM